MADDIAALLNFLHIEKAGIMGYSLGAGRLSTHHPPFRPDQDASSLNRFPTQWLVSRNSHRHRSIRFGGSRDEELNRMRVGERALFGAAPEVGKDDDAGHSGISAP
jgi:pimeloyl-ACP methyl ester carboxylesterase